MTCKTALAPHEHFDRALAARDFVDLIDDILDLAGVEAGRARVVLESHEAGEAIDAAMSAVELQASSAAVAKGLSIRNPGSGGCPTERQGAVQVYT